MPKFARLRCRLTGHAWRDWSTYQHAGRGVFLRTRDCGRCGNRDTEKDG